MTSEEEREIQRLAQNAGAFQKYDDIMKSDFPKNLKRAIERSGMSKREFARRVGVASGTVSHWCQGKKTPRSAHIDAICEALGTTWQKLVYGQDEATTGLTPEETEIVAWYRQKGDEEIKDQIRALIEKQKAENEQTREEIARIDEEAARLQKAIDALEKRKARIQSGAYPEEKKEKTSIEELEQQESAISFVGFPEEAKEGMKEVAAEVDRITSEADDLFEAGDQIIATIPDEPPTVAGEPLNLGDINFTLKP